jgi:hypothetical protein
MWPPQLSYFLKMGNPKQGHDSNPSITLKDFVVKSGGLLAALVKLNVSTSTLQKLLSGHPVSTPTAKKVLGSFQSCRRFHTTRTAREAEFSLT